MVLVSSASALEELVWGLGLSAAPLDCSCYHAILSLRVGGTPILCEAPLHFPHLFWEERTDQTRPIFQQGASWDLETLTCEPRSASWAPCAMDQVPAAGAHVNQVADWFWKPLVSGGDEVWFSREKVVGRA